VHEVAHFLGAVVGAHEVAPIGATFEDGYQAALVCDAIIASSSQGCRVPVAQMA
jgi:predicted dehydrogenase